MICPACQHENPGEAKFCLQCLSVDYPGDSAEFSSSGKLACPCSGHHVAHFHCLEGLGDPLRVNKRPTHEDCRDEERDVYRDAAGHGYSLAL